MITGFSLNGEEYIWTRHPNFSECNRPRFGVPVLFPNCGLPDNGVHIFDGKAYPMEDPRLCRPVRMGSGQRWPGRRDAGTGVHPADQVPLSV
mgnify:CR=1 FL=1